MFLQNLLRGSNDQHDLIKRYIKVLQNDINQAFRNFGNHPKPRSDDNSLISPAADILSDEKRYIVNVDMPGMDSSDVELKVDNRNIYIKATRKTKTSKNENDYIIHERYYGSFKRTIQLPEDANMEEVEAGFDKGILP